MTTLEKIEQLPEQEFQDFFSWLPERTKLLVRGGMSDWREVLPEWYEKYVEEE